VLSGVGYFLGDVLHAIGRALSAAGGELAGGWRSLSLGARRLLVAALALVALVVLFVGVAVPALPCGFPGGDRCPPADDAAQIVPGDALAYLHANVDSGTEQYDAAAELAGKVPLFADQIVERALALVPGPSGAPPDFDREIAPWFGGELALAVLPSDRRDGDTAVAIEADDSDAARRFADDVAAGRPRSEDYRGFELRVDERGVASAEIGGFLVFGTQSAVRAVIDTGSGAEGADPIASDPVADEVREQLPDKRLAEAYLSPEGAARFVADSSGLLGALAPLIAPGSTRGAGAALSVDGDAFELTVRSLLDPELERRSPSFFSAFPEFEPELPRLLDGEALAYVGIGAPGRTVSALAGQAADQAPAIAESFEDLARTLKEESEVDLESDLLPALGDEAALAVEPRVEGGQGSAGVPYLQFVARGVDEERAKDALAGLQVPLAEAAGTGVDVQAPVFGEEEVDGVQVRTLRLSPNLELAYAVFDGLAVIASDPAGVAQVASGDGGLDESSVYRTATDGFEHEASLIAFLDLRRLITAGFAVGLAQVPAFNTFAEDFRALEALAIQVRGSDEEISTDARLVLGEPEDSGEDAAAPAPSD
jgi:Protein of unknown function (DUF3352)